jgi:hypothetical protein
MATAKQPPQRFCQYNKLYEGDNRESKPKETNNSYIKSEQPPLTSELPTTTGTSRHFQPHQIETDASPSGLKNNAFEFWDGS